MTTTWVAGPALAGLAALALRIAALASCAPMNSAGADGGADAAASTTTVGDQCTKIETAFCSRAQACLALTTTYSQCLSDGQTQCCGSKCSAASSTTEQSVDACTSAVAQLDCNAIATGATPQACAGIPKAQ